MLTAKLNGGLCNQLFQIATAHALALDNCDECAFYLDSPVINQGNTANTYKTNVLKNIKELSVDWEPEFIWQEMDLNYHPIPYHKNMMLVGYFGSEKYFGHHRVDIIRLFKPPMTSLNNCATLHVRRGDYQKFTNVFYCLDVDYYRRTLDIIKSDIIYVLSDDVEWCKNNLKDDRLFYPKGQADWEDLYLMSRCEHNIIANSTFSWWGSYLNENPDKIVIAPKKWHVDEICKDIYCNNWILI